MDQKELLNELGKNVSLEFLGMAEDGSLSTKSEEDLQMLADDLERVIDAIENELESRDEAEPKE